MLEITPTDWCRAFVPATVHHGSPVANTSAVIVSQLAERARSCGVKVLMTGEGADELFGGYPGIHGTEIERFLPLTQRSIRRLEPKLLGNPWRFLDAKLVASKVKGSLAQRLQGQSAVNPTWAAEMSPVVDDELVAGAMAAYAHHSDDRQVLEAALLSRLDFSLCWLLNRMDKNVMQASVEARVPFLEPDVVELALNLPLEARVGPWSKGILRDVARRVLPWQIAHRPKIHGMAFDGASWIEQEAEPSFLSDGFLRELVAPSHQQFDLTMATAGSRLRLRLWSAEVWCRSALGGQSISEIETALWR